MLFRSKIKEVAEYLKTQNIDVYKYKTKGLFHEKKGYQTWFKNNVVDVISKKYPYYSPCIPSAHTSEKIVDGIRLYNNQSPTNIVELYDKITNQYKQGKATVNKNNKLLIKSIEYANEHNIEIDDLPTDYIIKRVEEYAKEKWLNENVPNGTEIYLKHACSECSTYIMGERRCSCGNRRISIVVEGNILEGFYYYPEPY